jgi:hypothetical protein
MSKHQQKFHLEIPTGIALQYCQEVARSLGWRVFEVKSDGLSIKEATPQATSFTWAARIDIILKTMENDQCEIQLYGSIMGYGPIQSNHLQGQMGRFLNELSLHIDTKAKNNAYLKSSSDQNTNLSDEVSKLHDLFKQGVLTLDEFTSAKSRLFDTK